MKRPQKKSAFTLLESLLAIVLIGITITMGIATYQPFQRKNDIDLSVNLIINHLRKAQTYSEASKQESPWGVKILQDQVTLFKGTDYSTRDVTHDEELKFFRTFTVSGTSEFTFQKNTGYPIAIGTLTLLSEDNEDKNITINEKGSITY